MEKEGYVSLWLGNFAKQEQVEEILQIAYSDEGDFVPSIFAVHFNITRYDDADGVRWNIDSLRDEPFCRF